jgi:hypothetical protein
MSKTARADWAASVPWAGITGKPPLEGTTDIGQLTALGFSPNQIPRWNGTRFVAYSIPPSPTPVAPTNPFPPTDYFIWDTPSVLPLQTATENFPLIGAVPGEPIAFGIAFDPGFCLVGAVIFANDLVQLRVTNMDGISPVDFPAGLWSIQRF